MLLICSILICICFSINFRVVRVQYSVTGKSSCKKVREEQHVDLSPCKHKPRNECLSQYIVLFLNPWIKGCFVQSLCLVRAELGRIWKLIIKILFIVVVWKNMRYGKFNLAFENGTNLDATNSQFEIFKVSNWNYSMLHTLNLQ